MHLAFSLADETSLVARLFGWMNSWSNHVLCSEKKLCRRQLLPSLQAFAVAGRYLSLAPALGLADQWPRWWLESAAGQSTTRSPTTGSANWGKIKWKSGSEGGGDRHQKERKQVQGDAGTDLVCSCGPCLLEWCIFLASSRCCYMAGRPFPPRPRLCFVPRQGQAPFLLRHARLSLDLLWPGRGLPWTLKHRQDRRPGGQSLILHFRNSTDDAVQL